MPFTRREFCFATGVSLFVTGCGDASLDIPKNLPRTQPMQALSDDEFKLISGSAKSGNPITISNRVIGPPHRLDDTAISNISFVNCDFVGHLMFEVDMKNMSFTSCAFHGVRWEGNHWNDLEFRGCLFIGNNAIQGFGDEGHSLFQDCKMKGMEPDNPDGRDDLGFCGEITVPGNGRMENCDLVRMIVYCGKRTDFKNCRFLSGALSTFQDEPAESITLMNCSNSRMFSCIGLVAKSFVIRDCDFTYVQLSRLRGNTALVENTKGSFGIGGSQLTSLRLANCTFLGDDKQANQYGSQQGLWARISTIQNFTIERCKFEGSFASLSLPGDPPQFDANGKVVPRKTGDGKEIVPYISTIGTLRIVDTPIPRADLSFTQIGVVSLEGSSLKDAKLSDSHIGALNFKNASLGGTLDFSRSVVTTVKTDALTRESSLKLVKDKATQLDL